MKKQKLSYNRHLLLGLLLFFFSTNSFGQTMSFDTLKDYRDYSKYISLSKEMITSIKNNQGVVLNEYFRNPGLYHRQDLEKNLSYVHNLLQHTNASLKSVVLENYSIPFSGHIFKKKELLITYSFGKSGCTNAMLENSITITYYDISKGETHFEFGFENCEGAEKVIKAIMDVPVPKK